MTTSEQLIFGSVDESLTAHAYVQKNSAMTALEFVAAGIAAIAAGAINALAGGGTLITFPMLTAIGVPAVAANVTNTIALCPGYIGATLAQSKDLRGQKRRAWILIPTSLLGGLAGGLLLLKTGEQTFRSLVPYLILFAACLLAVQEPVKRFMAAITGSSAGNNRHTIARHVIAVLAVFVAAIYGGYFGAGASVIYLAVLGLVLKDSLTRLNALKQALAFGANIAAAVLFVFSGKVLWPVALVMAIGAIIGGVAGGRIAGRIRPAMLRWVVVAIGVIVSIIYFVR